MSKIFDELKVYLEKGDALSEAQRIFEWDSATLAPKLADENTARVVGILSDMYFKTYVNEDVKRCLKELEKPEEFDKLAPAEKAQVKELRRLVRDLEKLPPEEYREFSELVARAMGIWEEARENDDYEKFAPVLAKIIEFQKKFAGYRMEPEKHSCLYDVLLDEYEPGFTVEKLDEFFEVIRSELVPFIKEVVEKAASVDKSYNEKHYDVEKQKELSHMLAEYVGFDFDKGVMAESAHPFTTNFHNKDVRITNHFYENNLESAIFSVIHESGHALYEMQVADEFTQTLVGEGTSMGMHESQSRFFENIIGRSEEFWKPLYGKLIDMFPEQLVNVSLEQFILGSNKPVPGPIRTEADELTYALHILVRYEIEKMIFNNEVSVDELPKVWNEKYEEYLGITPKNDAEGILQDVHWCGGDFGYFPSYALGSAVAAQIYYQMKKVLPFDECLEQGKLEPIRAYLKEHIHRFGKSKNTNEILRDMMGEEFNPEYYVKYLKEKYTKLYLEA